MADYFSIKLGKKVDYSHIYQIMKDQAKIQQVASHKNFDPFRFDLISFFQIS